jgi:amino acid adenylation domain-containing protein
VAICLKRSIYTIPTIIGVLKAGATYVPFDKDTPLSRMEFMLKDSEATLLLTEKGVDIPSAPCPISYINDIIINETADSTSVVSEMPHTAYIIYTSGTTGTPKATPISTTSLHQLIHNIIHHNKWINEQDCVLQMASISFDASIVDIFVALYSGATLVLADDDERKDIGLLLDLLIREQVSFATIPPAVMAILPVNNLPAMKTMVFAGEATPKEVFDRWQNKGIRIVNAYGPTENSVCSTFADITETSSATNIGKPLTNVSCYVLDKNLHLLPFGVVGELYLGGNQLTDGYLNQDDLNSKSFVKNPYATIEQTENNVNQLIYKTGDIVYLKPDFTIEYLGRADFQIKLNGHRIELEEIERRLIMHPDINQSVATIITQPNGQKQIAAYIQLQSDNKAIPSKELHEFLAKNLPEYMIPTKWVIVNEFKLTTNGKIDRSSLPKESDLETSDYKIDYVAPATASEHILVDIFSRILEIDHISVKANLFEEYGVESIQAMSAIYEAKRQGIELSVSTLYKNKSIRASLRDNKTYPYYWYNEEDENKPVIIIICGLVYLQPYHHDLLELLKDKYTILILESIHEYFFMKEDCTFASLLDRYMKVLPKMLKGKKLLGITGWCIGGEIALQLAVEMKQAGVASPIVFSLDGYLHHDVDKNAPLFYMNFPNVPEEINKERDRIKNEFIASIFFRPYNGKVYCFLADQFSKYPPNGEILSDEEVDFNYKSFKKNPGDWETLQPGCIRIFIHDNHYTFLQKKNMIEIVKVMDKERELFLET